MAKKNSKSTKKDAPKRPFRPFRWLSRWIVRGCLLVVAFVFLAVGLFAVLNPPITPYMMGESRRLGGLDRDWVPMEQIAPVMARSAVAAEDANYCLHWGLDLAAIQAALDAGGSRGASTISQQVVKNVYLWHGRSWVRKAIEAVLTPVVELVWSKRRILEVYLNVAEFDEGVFGVQAASRHYFGVDAADLSQRQAARLAVLLPNPKERDPNALSQSLRNRAAGIADGAATILADGRAACFED
ncbi:monofunctional biosynthetic peptidoglycan transglycosylase [Flavimaricola marinus]|uniref:Biosynthetic peptidoglycan transglycosylase n=1 Tax=Flavimaricola marinus TaxID=1819565 RepID=A0A238LIY9_9RHOB|nr:monofunctional biosynthetic peptidoglycan transglycosylase [Flavimaricola marinus]SMY09374.1 Penicillin-binding protein 2D [Flavimaricola marinus]